MSFPEGPLFAHALETSRRRLARWVLGAFPQDTPRSYPGNFLKKKSPVTTHASRTLAARFHVADAKGLFEDVGVHDHVGSVSDTASHQLRRQPPRELDLPGPWSNAQQRKGPRFPESLENPKDKREQRATSERGLSLSLSLAFSDRLPIAPLPQVSNTLIILILSPERLLTPRARPVFGLACLADAQPERTSERLARRAHRPAGLRLNEQCGRELIIQRGSLTTRRARLTTRRRSFERLIPKISKERTLL